MDHGYWRAYLRQGKRGDKTTDRPLNGQGATKRVHLFDNGDIGLRYHSTYCVIFHTNGSVTINTGGWHTVSTFRFLNDHSPVRVFTQKGQPYIYTSDPTYTPVKIQKCRTCHGIGTIPRSCYGPGWCYPSYKAECGHGETSTHKRELCEHGQASGHPNGHSDCYRCSGQGRVDYGSKPIHVPWGGGHYRFYPDDPATQLLAVHPTYMAPTHVLVSSSSQDWSNSRTILSSLMPDMDRGVAYPCSCGSELLTATVSTVIIHLNDGCHWSRERVADWLETLDLDLRFPITAA